MSEIDSVNEKDTLTSAAASRRDLEGFSRYEEKPKYCRVCVQWMPLACVIYVDIYAYSPAIRDYIVISFPR